VESAESHARPRIAEIISSSGVIESSTDASANVMAEVVTFAEAVVPGNVEAKVIAAAAPLIEPVEEALLNRFKLSPDAVVTRDYSVPYETAGRALILALHALDAKLKTAFDTATGALLEAIAPEVPLGPSCTLTISLGDAAPNTTRVTATSHLALVDVLKLNERKVAALFAHLETYLARFAD